MNLVNSDMVHLQKHVNVVMHVTFDKKKKKTICTDSAQHHSPLSAQHQSLETLHNGLQIQVNIQFLTYVFQITFCIVL